jgi:hypothetical protein
VINWVKNNFPNRMPVMLPRASWYNMVGRILSDLRGEGCRVIKTKNGLGWTIVVDSIVEGNYHFEVAYASTTSVTVRAGRYTRYSNATQYTVLMDIDGGGTSGDLDDIKTITGLSNPNTTYRIILTLSDSTPGHHACTPDTLTPSAVTSYPVAEVGRTKWVLAEIQTDSGGSLDPQTLKPHWDGGDIIDFYDEVDNISLEYASDGKRQAHQYNDGAPVPVVFGDPINDCLFGHDSGNAQCDWMSSQGVAEFLTNPDGYWDTGAGQAPWQQASAVSHLNLSNLDAWDAAGPAKHSWAWVNHFDFGGGTYYDDYTRNNCQSIGNTAGGLVIDNDNRQLEDGAGNVYLDWALGLLQNSGTTTLDWINQILYDGATIALRWSGGWIEVNPNGTYRADFGDDVGGWAGHFTDGTRTVYVADGTHGVEVQNGDIECDGQFIHAGTGGAT